MSVQGSSPGETPQGPTPGGPVVLDVRAARWYAGHGIGTYTAELFAALPEAHQGRRIIGWCEGRWTVPGGPRPDGWEERPLPGERFWTRAARLPRLSGVEALWHNPHSGLGSPGPGPPLVITIHDLIPLILPDAGRPRFVRAFCEQVPQAAARASRLIAVSGHTRGDLVRVLGIPPNRITVIPEAPRRCCRPISKDEAQARVRQSHGISAPFFLYLGGFGRRKNVAALVQAFSLVARQLPSQEVLVVVGSPDRTYGQVQALTHRLRCASRVAFLGHVKAADLPYLYGGAEAFVYPSLYEGFGLPPLEAMACGCPVICSDATSLPEVCGDAALLVDARDVGALAGAFRRLAEDRALARTLVEKGLKRAAAFSWTGSARRTLDVYSGALEAGVKPEGS